MNSAQMAFHFLRPEWLWLLLPALWLSWKLWQSRSQRSSWQGIINPSFKPILLGKSAEQAAKPWEVLGLLLIWFLTTLALAGPTWQEVKVPVEKSTEGTVILQDLSLSMLADDIKPNRITRTRYKLIDLLKQHPEMATGMVVYAGSAHTLAPISDDNQTLLSLIPNLTPTMMPKYGSDAVVGLKKAISLFKGAHVKKGHLIWVLDDIPADQVKPAIDLIKNANISVSILISGTPDGGPIPVPNYGLLKDKQGKIIMATIPVRRIQKLAQAIHAPVTLIQNTDADLSVLLPPFLNQLPQQAKNNEQKSFSDWLDKGVYLLLLLVPLGALAYRRGWLFSVNIASGLLALSLIGASGFYPSPSFAAETLPTQNAQHENASVHFIDVFKSPDQQGYEKWQHKEYQTAADRFENPQWKGASYYRAGDYQEALKQFRQDKSARGLYNQGNALAHLGKLKQAKQAYQQALKMRPDWSQAQNNLKLMDKLLQQQKHKQPPKSGKQSQNPNKQSAAGGSQQGKKGQENNQAKSSGQSDGKSQSNKTPGQQNDLNRPVKPNKSDKSSEQQKPSQSESNAKQSQTKSSDNPSKNPSGQMGKQGSELSKVQAKPGESKPKPATAQPKQLADQIGSPKGKALAKKLTEQQQAEKAWLNQIPDQPGLFLKRKFEYQYQLQHQNADNDQQNAKIW